MKKTDKYPYSKYACHQSCEPDKTKANSVFYDSVFICSENCMFGASN